MGINKFSLKRGLEATKLRLMDRQFALIIALLVTALIFCPFLGQELFSDVMTFQKKGDALQLTYPAFMRAWDVFVHGGVDVFSDNGATEMAIRTNLPMAYPLFILFSLLGKLSSYRFAYILFFAVHMVAFLYFGFRTVQEHFGLNRRFACLCVLSSLATVFVSSWYVSFYIITCLIWVLLYAAIKALSLQRKRYLIVCALPYVLTFCGGYSTLAVFACAFAFIVTILYGLLWMEQGENRIARAFGRSITPPLLAGVVVLTYYVEMLVYTKKVVKAGSSLSSALNAALAPQDLLGMLSQAFTMQSPIEGNYTIYIGFAWAFLLAILCMKRSDWGSIRAGQRKFLYGIFGIVIVLVLISFGSNSIFQYWYYALVPILGTMHLPIRNLLIAMPLLFLAMTMLVSKQMKCFSKKIFSTASIVMGSMLLILLFCRSGIPYIEKQEILIVECLFFFAFLVSANHFGIDSKLCIAMIIGCTIIISANTHFYESNQIDATSAEIEASSIVFSDRNIDAMDDYISSSEDKKLYKMITVEPADDSTVTSYVPRNYAWYQLSEYNLTSYRGYELHLGVPEDYRNRFDWWNITDWEYIANTRGDLAIIHISELSELESLYGEYLDLTNPPQHIGNDYYVCKLKKFIPSYYIGSSFVIDENTSMDNGYFYAPNLSNDCIEDFSTDDASYFRITLNADHAEVVAFLLYNNRNYHYYVDGMEIEPTVQDMQAFIPIDQGVHAIEVKYENILPIVSKVIFCAYYFVCGIIVIVFLVGFYSGKRRSLKNESTR